MDPPSHSLHFHMVSGPGIAKNLPHPKLDAPSPQDNYLKATFKGYFSWETPLPMLSSLSLPPLGPQCLPPPSIKLRHCS